jgi:hypothetical protein
MIRLLCWAVFLVFLCAITPVIARELPDAGLIAHIEQYPVVHRGTCKIDSMKIDGAPCQIFFDSEREVVWLCLYDKHGLTHIIASKQSKEQIVWVRPSLTS